MSAPSVAGVDGGTTTLCQTIDRVLEPFVRPGTPCALLGFPNHSNVGDSAIWLGQLAWLRRRGAPIVYTCETTTFSAARLRARVGDGIILICGGGSLGDLWPHFQPFVETVIREFPESRVIQLPQSIHFADTANLARARAVFDAHPRFTLLVRDRQSLAVARNAFRADSRLCPDMALALGALARPRGPTTDVMWLARTDRESRASSRGLASRGVMPRDWKREWTSPLCVGHRVLSRLPALKRGLGPLLPRTYERLAARRLRRGCRFLARGRVVITDRLHGHILSLLLGIPHVVLDNTYGKNRAFYETWTLGSPLAVWADSAQDALSHTRALLRC